MSDRVSSRVIVYICAVALVGVAVVVFSPRLLGGTPGFSWFWVCLYLAVGILVDTFPIVFYAYGVSKVEIVVSEAVIFAVACLFPPQVAAGIAVIQTLVSDRLTHKEAIKSIFNMALYAIAVGGASLAYHRFVDVSLDFLAMENVRALVLSAVWFLGSEYLLLAGLFSLLSRGSFVRTLGSLVRTTWLTNLTLLLLGIVIMVLYWQNPWTVLFLVPVFVVLYYALKREQTLRSQTQTILEKLVDVLESKSPETAQHSKRVRAWVDDMCDELGMESSEADMVLQAAVLHDLGKVGLDDNLLRKPGLSAEEFHQIMGHSAVSASLLEGLTLFQGGRDIVLHHHERYDGNGYPDHLAGENIPFGARIIAVADSFDAMVSVRPYRAKSLTVTEALKILDQERGAQFDPELVVTFTKLVRAHLATGDMTNFPSTVQIDSTDGVDIAAGVQV
ncbi:HD-GYP domain-containing protein [Candidatus Cryosericum odellii]|uniref:HD domain-containing protein n=1 Tax=Candidatus Cryosericum odellii TaxID=2290917 RepID=A0A398D2A1_9BACT|nr:HD domain-containing phosphohydrolase [Candidatus Cryosericum odellii]RIE06766.1 HD domain-containing protein [Candidatus Cryosericum odellii]RIE07569.1 HD domain-containing protein [Candidatus Cryosericum odellii]